MKDKQIPADALLGSIDAWVRYHYRNWALEKEIEIYANGGPPPCDDPEFEDNIVPLGFAQSFMKREMAPLLDPIGLEPGILDGTLVTPALNIPERTLTIQSQIMETVNEVVMARLKSELINLAGRSTVTGRGVLYRKSPNDTVLRCGRIIHPPEAGIDPLDSEFREWAFPGQISLRDIESRLKGSDKGKYGWNKAGLEQLKLWIMAAESERYSNGSSETGPEWTRDFSRDGWLGTDLTRCGFAKPVDVYWYFRKNGDVTKDDVRFGGQEKIDLYCISRFGSEKEVLSTMKDASTREKSYNIKYKSSYSEHLDRLEKDARSRAGSYDDEDKKETCNQRLLFYLPDVFKGVDDCLIVHIDDAAIAGEQRLNEVRGTGRVAMPKLAVMEQLLTSIVEGLTFGAQPNWSVAAGVPEEYMKQLQRGGLRSGQAFPQGVNPMQKQNAFTGFSHAMGFVRMLDTGVSADSAANTQGTFGGTQAEFAAQASADLNQRQQTVNLRLGNWLCTMDKVVNMVARTICRAWPEMKKEFPCYYEAQRMRMILRTRYDIHEDEWDADRWMYKARRLAGGMMRQQAVAVNTQMLQIVGPHEPTLIPMFIREIIRSTYGDTVATQWLNPPEETKLSQVAKAQENVTISFVTGQVPPPVPSDNPIEHARVAVEVFEGRMKAYGAAGQISQADMVGMMGILQYAVQHIMRVPEQVAKPAMQKVQEMAKMLQSIPVQQPKPEGAMTEKEMAELQIKQANQQRLLQDQQLKSKNTEVEQMLNMRKLANAERQQAESQKNLAVQRAAGIVGIQESLNDADVLPDPFAIPDPA